MLEDPFNERETPIAAGIRWGPICCRDPRSDRLQVAVPEGRKPRRSLERKQSGLVGLPLALAALGLLRRGVWLEVPTWCTRRHRFATLVPDIRQRQEPLRTRQRLTVMEGATVHRAADVDRNGELTEVEALEGNLRKHSAVTPNQFGWLIDYMKRCPLRQDKKWLDEGPTPSHASRDNSWRGPGVELGDSREFSSGRGRRAAANRKRATWAGLAPQTALPPSRPRDQIGADARDHSARRGAGHSADGGTSGHRRHEGGLLDTARARSRGLMAGARATEHARFPEPDSAHEHMSIGNASRVRGDCACPGVQF